MDLVGVVLGEPEIERGERGDRPGDADRCSWADVLRDAVCEQLTHRCAARVELLAGRRIRVEEALGQADAAEVEAVMKPEAVRPTDDEFGRAAPDVDHERVFRHLSAGGDAPKGQLGFLVPGEQPGLEAVAPLDLAEESLAVLGVANGAGRDCERALGAEPLCLASKVGEHVPNPGDRGGGEALALVDALTEASDLQPSGDLVKPPVLDIRPEPPRGGGAADDSGDTHPGRLL